jgi:hypothetical protein
MPRISELPEAGAIEGSEEVALIQGGVTRRAAVSAFLAGTDIYGSVKQILIFDSGLTSTANDTDEELTVSLDGIVAEISALESAPDTLIGFDGNGDAALYTVGNTANDIAPISVLETLFKAIDSPESGLTEAQEEWLNSGIERVTFYGNDTSTLGLYDTAVEVEQRQLGIWIFSDSDHPIFYGTRIRETGFVVDNDDVVTEWRGQAWSGASNLIAGNIKIAISSDGTVGTTSMPGEIQFSTTRDGQATPSLAVTIDRQQNVIMSENLSVSGVIDQDGVPVVLETREINAGTGLEGGGDLSDDITLSLSEASIGSLGLADSALQPEDVKNSIEVDTGSLQLVGDSATPGNGRYYGTDGSGTRGFHSLPAGDGVTVKNSIEVDNDDLQLVGDAASPGNSKYYGTNGSGTKGFHDVPPAGVPETREINSGTGLEGGGDLSANRTLSLTSAVLASLDLADSALQSVDIADFETTTQLNSRDTANRDRVNHTGTQTLSTISDAGTAAAEDVEFFATAAQGNLADSALQPEDVKNSIEVDTGSLQLVGDSAAPGNGRYYGTDGSGTRGFHSLPSGDGVTVKNSIEVDDDDLQLVGDAAAPGNSKYYGTNASGTKGFHDQLILTTGNTDTTAGRALDASHGVNLGSNQTVAGQKTFAHTAETTVAMSDNAVDCSEGNYFTRTINGAAEFTFTNVPSAKSYAFTLELTHTSGAVTWPASVKWPDDTAPTLTTGKTHIFVFVTVNGGTRWRGASLVDYVA